MAARMVRGMVPRARSSVRGSGGLMSTGRCLLATATTSFD